MQRLLRIIFFNFSHLVWLALCRTRRCSERVWLRIKSICTYHTSQPCRPGVTNGSYIVEYFIVTQGGYKVAVRPSPQSQPLTEVHQWPKQVS